MVEVPCHYVVRVITVRNRIVSAVGSVLVTSVVAFATVVGGALFGIRCVYGELVLVHVGAVHVMQMSVIKVIGMTFVHHRLVPALRSVGMGMTRGMSFVGAGRPDQGDDCESNVCLIYHNLVLSRR